MHDCKTARFAVVVGGKQVGKAHSAGQKRGAPLVNEGALIRELIS